MEILSIVFFFVAAFGLGTLATVFAGQQENFLERNLMKIGIGMGALITLGLLLNIFGIPLDYRIFLGISIASILFYLLSSKALQSMKASDFKLTKSDLLSLAVLLLFFITFFMYHKGAFSYPYLEDDDSWAHAIGVKYVAVEKTVSAPKIGIRYVDPYPPGYDMLFGIIHQTNDSVYWTLKFFNALVISLSIIFFYFFARLFTGNPKKAFFSAFALFAIPSFLSHFIWSIAITMPLLIVSFYCIERIKINKGWWIPSAIVIAATFTTSPTHSAYFGVFLAISLALKNLAENKFLIYESVAGILGFGISFALWWGPAIFNYGFKGVLSGVGVNLKTSILDIAGTADRVYSIGDFFIAQKANMINNPIGVGIVISLLVLVGVVALLLIHYKQIRKSKIAILSVFLMFLIMVLPFLSYTYVKYATKKSTPQLKVGSVPFMEFLSDEAFLVASISILLFLLASLIVIIHKNKDFKEKYLAIVLAWAAFCFFAVNASPFYYKLSPFRAWIVLAIPISLLAGESISIINGLVKSLSLGLLRSNKAVAAIASLAVLGLLGYGIVMTSFVQKYSVNTSLWPPGAFWASNEEIQGYIWFKDNLPAQSKVFTFSNNAVVIGLDKFICSWCGEVSDYKSKGFNQTSEENYNWLKRGQYNYVVIDGQAARRFGFNETNHKVQSLIGSSRFKPVFNNNGIIIFGVN